MEKYTVKELYKILGRALKNLPFMITYHGKPKAIVFGVDEPVEDLQEKINEMMEVENE